MEKEGGVHEDPKGIFFLKVCSVYFYSILKHYDRCWTDSCVQTVERPMTLRDGTANENKNNSI